jgi:hypothetical protein
MMMNWKGLRGLRKTTKNVNEDNQSLGHPKYEAGVLTTQPRCSVGKQRMA